MNRKFYDCVLVKISLFCDLLGKSIKKVESRTKLRKCRLPLTHLRPNMYYHNMHNLLQVKVTNSMLKDNFRNNR